MKKLSIILVFLIIFSCKEKNLNQSNHTNKDSLSIYLDLANNDSLSQDLRRKFTFKAISIIEKSKIDSTLIKNYFKVANRFYNIGDYENYKKISKKNLQFSILKKDTSSQVKAYQYLIDYYNVKFVADSAYEYNYKIEKIYRKQKKDLELVRTLLNKAVMQHNERDILSCERTVLECLKLLRNIDEDYLLYQSYTLLGICYSELTEYELANNYYAKSLEIAERHTLPPNYQATASAYNNIGILLRDQNQPEKALKYFQLGIEQKNLMYDNPVMYATLLDNLSYIKFKNKKQKNIINSFSDALRIRDSLKVIPGIIISKLHISEYYRYHNNQQLALKYAKEANDLSMKSNEKRDELMTLKYLSDIDFLHSKKYTSQYFKINDSLQLTERKISNKFARIEFETEELTIEKDKLVEQRKGLIYIGLGILTIGLFIFVIRMQAAKNRELVLLQEQQKANEDVYQLMLNQQNKIEEVRQSEKKRIAQELHDGVLGKLFGTRMNLGVLNSKNDDKSINDRSLFIDELKNLEQEIREISHDLSSEKAAIFNNFVLMVNNFIATQRTVCKAEIEIFIDEMIDWNHVSNMSKINLYRILQEAFQNVNKHANAKHVIVNFFIRNNMLHLDVKDDGIGFVYSRKKKGIGLLNMKARIADSAGTMQIVTEPSKGTLLKFELPLSSPPQ